MTISIIRVQLNNTSVQDNMFLIAGNRLIFFFEETRNSFWGVCLQGCKHNLPAYNRLHCCVFAGRTTGILICGRIRGCGILSTLLFTTSHYIEFVHIYGPKTQQHEWIFYTFPISSIITGAHAHSNKEKESDANQLASDGCLNSESMMRFFCLGLRNVLDATTAK
ncbi:uncharacterized protein isoform X1 [Musca autumnalis]|uniref:uncharacterized protein isoform X1 n=1 Tax=Musca autumnalis TaxID=221902 RepID=UPI003CF363EE